MSIPKVSVIVPNYNHAKFLKQRLDSILNQTYQDFEIIILDDCSTDNSRAIIESYRNNKKITKIVYNTNNSGSPFKQWKKGIELAKGEYIWIAESDDIANFSFLQKMILTIQKYKTASLIFSESELDINFFDQNITERIEHIYDLGENFIKKKMLYNCSIINASAVLFKSNSVDNFILEEITKYNSTGDWLFWNYLASRGDVINLIEKLNYFRQNSSNIVKQRGKDAIFLFEGFKVILFTVKILKINLGLSHIKLWSSIWAQYYLSNVASFRKNFYTAIKTSYLIPIYFIYYYCKYLLTNTKNINIATKN
ncbi:glycosyltransferase family 2 protein [Pedobacter sp. N23S346]|uniref:glycosyltransferase family 2 protein n=1 Tax=Pedobacter sp. N23S346 TaxID=3402750 RepID=UPI003AC80BE4